MRLLYITNGISGGGGLERVLSIKTSYFAEEFGYDVHIITLNDSAKTFFPFSPSINIHPITVTKNWKYLFSYINGINKIVSKIKPDIILVCDDGLKGLYVPLWIKKGHAKIIYERHASLTFNGSIWQKKLMQLGAYLYDKIVVLSPTNCSEWKSQNLVVIPNPASFQTTKTAILENPQIICVGSIESPNKGYDLLIKAWGIIAHKYPSWSIHIYGRGDKSIYTSLLNKNKIENQIRFHGTTNNIENAYLQASMLILPSRSEGFGMVLIEAMTLGVPCISFDCPCGPRDIIENSKNGFLVEPENIYKLAEKIEDLINHISMRKEMGSYAKQTAQKYQISEIALLWKELIEKC